MALILAPISFCKLLASVCTLGDGASSFSRISLAAVAPSSVGLALHAARACLTISKFLLSSEVLCDERLGGLEVLIVHRYSKEHVDCIVILTCCCRSFGCLDDAARHLFVVFQYLFFAF